MLLKIREAALPAAALVTLIPCTASGQGIPPWLQQSLDRRSESLENIDLYVKRSNINIPGMQMVLPGGAVGPCTGSLCRAVIVEETDIPGITIERELSPMELAVLSGNTNSAFLDAIGQGMIGAQNEINSAFGGPTGSDLLGELDDEGGGNSLFLMLNPLTMFAAGGKMILETANAVAEAEESLETSNDQGQAEAELWAQVLPTFESAGQATVGTMNTMVYRSDNLNLTPQQVEDQQFDLTSAMLYIDEDSKAFVKQRFEGTATMEGQTREMFIEVENSDFRNPPGCGQMYEPYRRTMRMGGILNDEQMAQMQEAQAQIAEFEKQMASMPAQQRQMMERMIGPQMQMLRGLVTTGSLEYVEETEEILCDPDLAALFSLGPLPAPDQDLVRQVQEYLVILGYEPGNIDGVMDDLTRIAISQFQAERGLPVTGEPTIQLAALLAEAATA